MVAILVFRFSVLMKIMAEQTGLVPDKEDDLIIFNARISKNVEDGLHQRKVDVKTVKQYPQPSNRRCVAAVFREYMRCIPRSGIFYRKLLLSRRAERQEMSGTGHRLLKSMCTEAKINMDGRRFTNHSGKVTCVTQLYESGMLKEVEFGFVIWWLISCLIYVKRKLQIKLSLL